MPTSTRAKKASSRNISPRSRARATDSGRDLEICAFPRRASRGSFRAGFLLYNRHRSGCPPHPHRDRELNRRKSMCLSSRLMADADWRGLRPDPREGVINGSEGVELRRWRLCRIS
jgi:hypothetical protein